MKQFYTCWVEGTSGGYGIKHPDFISAKAEAGRLASIPANDGKKVYVMCCLGFAKVDKVIWEDAEQTTEFIG